MSFADDRPKIPRGGFGALAIADNVRQALERLVDAVPHPTVDFGVIPGTVDDWLENWAECGITDSLNAAADAEDRELETDLVYAYAYLHGLADALDMTSLEVMDAWAKEQTPTEETTK